MYNSKNNNNVQKNEKQNMDVRRNDVVAVQYLTAAMPSKSNRKNVRSSEPGTSLPAGSKYASEAVEYVPGSDTEMMRDWFGACKRFQGVKRSQRPADRRASCRERVSSEV